MSSGTVVSLEIMAAPENSSTAVWYFIAATFILTMPNLLFPDLPLWGRVGYFVAGLVVMAMGGVVFRRELRGRRRGKADDASE